LEYFRRYASENVDAEFQIVSEYKFFFEKEDDHMSETESFNLSEDEIINKAIGYINELSPISDLFIENIGVVSRNKMNADGSAGIPEMLECEITVIPIINGLPVYSQDMYLRIVFNSEGITKASSNLPENLEDLNANVADMDYSEDILHEIKVANADSDVWPAYYLSENNELIRIYVVDCLSDNSMKILRADSGAEIEL